MLISWKYNFLFVHVPKTGGTTMTHALAPYTRFRDRLVYGGTTPSVRLPLAILLGPDKYIQRLTGWHAHLRLAPAARELGPERMARLTKVSSARNPFTWAYSFYAHIRRTPGHPLHDRVEDRSFYDIIPIMCDEGWARQTLHLCIGPSRDIATDFLCGFERLADDAETLGRRLGLPRPLNLKRTNFNPEPPGDLRTHFGARLDRFIEAHTDEFEKLGYSTDIARSHEPSSIPADLSFG